MMNTEPSQPPTTFQQKLDFTCGLAALPALSVIVFIRRRIGYRLLDSGWYLLVAGAVFLIGLYTHDAAAPFPYLMEWYALAIVLLGAGHRAAAWYQFRKGNPPHSYSSGISLFETKRTRRFVRAHNLVNRLVDPLVVATVGFMVREGLSAPMGNWLIFSSVGLLIYEQLVHHKAVERDMDTADGLIVAGVHSEAAEHFNGNDTGKAVADAGPVVSTGLGGLRAKPKPKRQK